MAPGAYDHWIGSSQWDWTRRGLGPLMKSPLETKRKATLWDFVGIIAIGFLLFGLAAIRGGQKYWELSAVESRQQEVTGLISARGPFGHGPTYKYNYNVDRKLFSGYSGDPLHYAGHKDRTVGDAVSVYYDPERPNRSSLFSFSERAKWEAREAVTNILFMVFVVGIAIARLLGWASGRRLNSRTPPLVLGA